MVLISQVELCSINRRIFNLYGSDIESTIVTERFTELSRLNDALDKWNEDWRDAITLGDKVASHSQHLFDVYLDSAKLYLSSHVFRGPSLAASPAGSSETEDLAGYAAESALSILRCAVDGQEDNSWLETLPCYFGTMIAFTCVCLIRTSLSTDSPTDSKTNEILRLLHRLAQRLQVSHLASSTTHPLSNIAKGLEAAIKERNQSFQQTQSEMNSNGMYDFAFDFDMFANDPLNLSFPGPEDNWMFCPEQMAPTIF